MFSCKTLSHHLVPASMHQSWGRDWAKQILQEQANYFHFLKGKTPNKQTKKIARGSEYLKSAGSKVSSFLIEKPEQSIGMVWRLKAPEWWLQNLSVWEGAHTDGRASDQNFANCLLQFYLTRLLTQSWENKCPLSQAPWARGLTHPGSCMLWEEDNPIEIYWECSASCVSRCLLA